VGCGKPENKESRMENRETFRPEGRKP